MATANYYQKNRVRLLELARIYREKNRAEINRKQRERYASSADYREYQRQYRIKYWPEYGE